MKTWVKVGLIGAVIQIVLTIPSFLIYFLPASIGFIIASIFSLLYLAVLPLVGVITTLWLSKPTTNREVVQNSALAGFLASVIDGIATLAFVAIAQVSGLMLKYIESSMPNSDLLQSNESIMWFLSLPGQLISTSICLAGNTFVSVLLSIVGGTVTFAILQRRTPSIKTVADN